LKRNNDVVYIIGIRLFYWRRMEEVKRRPQKIVSVYIMFERKIILKISKDLLNAGWIACDEYLLINKNLLNM